MFIAVKVSQGDDYIYYGNNGDKPVFVKSGEIKETEKIEVAVKDFLARLKDNEDVG